MSLKKLFASNVAEPDCNDQMLTFLVVGIVSEVELIALIRYML